MIKLYEENSKKLNDKHKLEKIEELEIKDEMYNQRRELARELKYLINHVELKENELRRAEAKRKDKASLDKMRD